MWKYILKDMGETMRYLPYGLVAGVFFLLIFGAVNRWRTKRNKPPVAVLAMSAFMTYVVIILCITFLSRENGTRIGIDLDLFSTWGINERNNAFVIENVLLFIPYGIVCAWAFKALRRFFPCAMIGLATSIAVECMQLYTGRGYFQVDDILTNLLGSIVGYVVFRIFWREGRHGVG